MNRGAFRLAGWYPYRRRDALRPVCIRKCFPIFLLLVVLLFIVATPSWAVQAHGGAEGLVSHQIGHLLFTAGMVFFLYRLTVIRPQGAGWLEFKTFLWLLVIWNIMTFSGHWMNEHVSADNFIKEKAVTRFFSVDSPLDAFFYLSSLDHLILVPSFLCLLLALRKWRVNQ